MYVAGFYSSMLHSLGVMFGRIKPLQHHLYLNAPNFCLDATNHRINTSFMDLTNYSYATSHFYAPPLQATFLLHRTSSWWAPSLQHTTDATCLPPNTLQPYATITWCIPGNASVAVDAGVAHASFQVSQHSCEGMRRTYNGEIVLPCARFPWNSMRSA